VELIGQFWGDVVIDVSGKIAPYEQDRPSRADPIEYFQPNGSIDCDEPRLVRG
jgi:hypothetical protein